MNVLGFDYGTRWIGVAVGNRLTGARPLLTIAHGGAAPPWRAIEQLVADWQPVALVVGLPLDRDGGEQAMSRAARGFARQLGERHGLPVHTIDERHTSQEANRRFAARRAAGNARRKDAAGLDALAAQVILESWLAESECRPDP
jgi:putative Holliday junction resolvase